MKNFTLKTIVSSVVVSSTLFASPAFAEHSKSELQIIRILVKSPFQVCKQIKCERLAFDDVVTIGNQINLIKDYCLQDHISISECQMVVNDFNQVLYSLDIQ